MHDDTDNRRTSRCNHRVDPPKPHSYLIKRILDRFLRCDVALDAYQLKPSKFNPVLLGGIKEFLGRRVRLDFFKIQDCQLGTPAGFTTYLVYSSTSDRMNSTNEMTKARANSSPSPRAPPVTRQTYRGGFAYDDRHPSGKVRTLFCIEKHERVLFCVGIIFVRWMSGGGYQGDWRVRLDIFRSLDHPRFTGMAGIRDYARGHHYNYGETLEYDSLPVLSTKSYMQRWSVKVLP